MLRDRVQTWWTRPPLVLVFLRALLINVVVYFPLRAVFGWKGWGHAVVFCAVLAVAFTVPTWLDRDGTVARRVKAWWARAG